MRVGFWNIYTELSTNNYCFTHAEAPIGAELLLPLNVLAELGRARGVEFVTLDLADRDEKPLDAILFADYPDIRHPLAAQALRAPVPKYLLTFEPPTVRPENFDEARHGHFTKVFTWDDVLVSKGGRYVKINYAQRFPAVVPGGPRPHLCTLIASNKQSSHPLSLYGERRDTIRAFESAEVEGFHLYGPGWEGHPSWRGMVEDKRKTLEAYDFAICYENAWGLPGYITEKIFDCFIAGCIPVYWGAPNIWKYVSAGCFIDRRGFHSNARLIDYLQKMTQGEKEHFRMAIRAWLGLKDVCQFTPEHFAQTILDTLQASPR